MDEPDKGETVKQCMSVYKAKIQSHGIIYKLKLINVVRGDFNKYEMIRDTCSPTASIRTLNYFLLVTSNNKTRVQ